MEATAAKSSITRHRPHPGRRVPDASEAPPVKVREVQINGSKYVVERGVPIKSRFAKREPSNVLELLRSLKRGESVVVDLSTQAAANKAQSAIGVGGYKVRPEGDGHTRVHRIK
jgi:hypothetical protein